MLCIVNENSILRLGVEFTIWVLWMDAIFVKVAAGHASGLCEI